MKILLDECIDRRFKRELVGHDVTTVPEAGWAGIKNGALMTLASANFEVFVTVDRNLSFQQNLPRFDIAVIVIRAISNRYQDLQPFAESVRSALTTAVAGEARFISLAETSSGDL